MTIQSTQQSQSRFVNFVEILVGQMSLNLEYDVRGGDKISVKALRLQQPVRSAVTKFGKNFLPNLWDKQLLSFCVLLTDD